MAYNKEEAAKDYASIGDASADFDKLHRILRDLDDMIVGKQNIIEGYINCHEGPLTSSELARYTAFIGCASELRARFRLCLLTAFDVDERTSFYNFALDDTANKLLKGDNNHDTTTSRSGEEAPECS